MTTEQLKALDALKKEYNVAAWRMWWKGTMRVRCYRRQHIGTAIIHTNGFVDWWPARRA